MKKLAMAAIAVAGLSIFSISTVQAQTRLGDLSEAREIRSDVPAGWDYDPYNQFTSLECERARGMWAPSRNGRILVCWLPRNGSGQLVTPYSPSVQPERPVRYDAAHVTIPEGLPASMCFYADHGRGCVSGETYFLNLVQEHGTGARAYARFRDDVEAMYRACGRLDVRLEEPRDRDRERRRYGYRYRGSGGGFSVRHDYERRIDEEHLTPDQVMYRQLLVLRGEGEAVCDVFRRQYEATNGFRAVRFG